MKRLLFLMCLLAGTQWIHAQVFVNLNATGTNDGTSWANAFTSLDQALNSVTSPQTIWVAKGVYVPDSSFVLKSGVNLFGGFAGTETEITQRNISANETVLSGDVLGDDILDNFTANRSDNRPRIMTTKYVNNLPVIIDGVSFKNGSAPANLADANTQGWSSAIWIACRLTLKNCTFAQNQARLGACFYAAYFNGSYFLNVEDCIFEGNNSTRLGGAALVVGATEFSFNRCVFKNNKGVAGGALFLELNDAGSIKGCTFTNNTALQDAGGGVFAAGSNITFENDTFVDNKARVGGGMYMNGSENITLTTFKNCLFKNNNSPNGFGGGLQLMRNPFVNLKNVTFDGNKAPTGGGLYINNLSSVDIGKINIDSCYFNANSATGLDVTQSSGGLFAGNIDIDITNSEFIGNKSSAQSGALSASETAVINVSNTVFKTNTAKYDGAFTITVNCEGEFKDCTFESNQSTVGSGGTGSVALDSEMSFSNCIFKKNKGKFCGGIAGTNNAIIDLKNVLFEENQVSDFGGALGLFSGSSATIDGCTFLSNRASQQAGAIVFGQAALSTIKNSKLISNFGKFRGGGIVVNNSELEMENCLIAKNRADVGGFGGGVAVFSGDIGESALTLTNCTLADNTAPVGAAISNGYLGAGEAKVILLNNIIQQTADSYGEEAGIPEVESLGGNQSSDNTLADYLTASKDELDVESSFVNTVLSDYHLLDGKGVDGGVVAGAPLKDLEGNSRVGAPDRGCYEYGTSSILQIGFKTLPLQINPNPVTDQAIISFNNAKTGPVEIAVWDLQGRRLITQEADKYADTFTYALNVSDLEPGAYQVWVTIGTSVHEGMMVKVQ